MKNKNLVIVVLFVIATLLVISKLYPNTKQIKDKTENTTTEKVAEKTEEKIEEKKSSESATISQDEDDDLQKLLDADQDKTYDEELNSLETETN